MPVSKEFNMILNEEARLWECRKDYGMMKKFDKVREETERIDIIRSYSEVVAETKDHKTETGRQLKEDVDYFD